MGEGTLVFPQFTNFKSLTQLEVEALRSLHAACTHLRQEFDVAAARTMGHYRLGDIAEDYARGRAFTHHREALHSLASAADNYEREVGMLAWRHAGAATVLGTTLLDRLVHGGPSLSLETVNRLCEEPTLGELREALSIPAADLLIARDEEFRDRQEEDRKLLLGRLEGIFRDAAHLGDSDGPLPDDVVAGWRLTEVSPVGMDPLYEGTLELLFSHAEGLPLDISNHLEHPVRSALHAGRSK